MDDRHRCRFGRLLVSRIVAGNDRTRTLTRILTSWTRGAAEGAAGSSLERGDAKSNKRAGTIFSVVFDMKAEPLVAVLIMSIAPRQGRVTSNLSRKSLYRHTGGNRSRSRSRCNKEPLRALPEQSKANTEANRGANSPAATVTTVMPTTAVPVTTTAVPAATSAMPATTAYTAMPAPLPLCPPL